MVNNYFKSDFAVGNIVIDVEGRFLKIICFGVGCNAKTYEITTGKTTGYIRLTKLRKATREEKITIRTLYV